MAFEAVSPRLTRSRAYASPASLPRPAQGSLPARAGSPLAGRNSHPLDDESKFHEVIAPPFPFDQQSLVALFFLCSPGVWSCQTPRSLHKCSDLFLCTNYPCSSARTWSKKNCSTAPNDRKLVRNRS
jgi:hypothetical protein